MFSIFDVVAIVAIVLMLVQIFVDRWWIFPITLFLIAIVAGSKLDAHDSAWMIWAFIWHLQLASMIMSFKRSL